MKFITFRHPGGAPEPGLIHGETVTALTGAGFTDILQILSGGAAALEAAAQVTGPQFPLSGVTLMAPVPRPPKVICIGLNYRDHAIESGMAIPTTPVVFSKWPSCVIGPNENIVLPKMSTQPDYEAELAFVIGKGGRHIAAENWKDHVFGYTILNDVSARDIQLKTSQWIMGKSFDTFAPMGPWLVTADEIADPHELRIGLRIHGETLQDSNTRELIFRIPELVAYLSSVFTLEPGDVVSTGTPPGVGFARKPPRLLTPGDVCEVFVDGLGELVNPVVAE